MTRNLAFVTVALPIVLLSATASPARAQPTAARPSFSCAGVVKAPERMICADPELARLDRIMADLFSETRSLLLNSEQTIQADMTQRAWLARRNRCGAMQCLRTAYFSRIVELARELPDNG